MLPRSLERKFVIFWTRAKSPGVVAAFMKMKEDDVCRVAQWMVDEGVQLKTFPRKKAGSKRLSSPDKQEGALTARQWEFFERHYAFAYQYARKVSRRHGTFGRQAPDIVEDAAINVLLKVSRRSTAVDFRPATAIGLLKVAIIRGVRDALLKQFGRDGSKKPQFASGGVEHLAIEGREPEPLQSLVEHEQESDPAMGNSRSRRRRPTVMTMLQPIAN